MISHHNYTVKLCTFQMKLQPMNIRKYIHLKERVTSLHMEMDILSVRIIFLGNVSERKFSKNSRGRIFLTFYLNLMLISIERDIIH